MAAEPRRWISATALLLFAAGVVAAHQDWIRSRSGAGIAIATAYKAVLAAEAYLRESPVKLSGRA